MKKIITLWIVAICSLPALSAKLELSADGRIATLSTNTEAKVRISAYGRHILRVQTTFNTSFLPDNHYEMVSSHQWKSELSVKETDTNWLISPKNNGDLYVAINKENFQATFYQNGQQMLAQKQPISKQAHQTKATFVFDESEHFTGLGHSFYGREKSLDLKGQRTGRNYGSEPIEQAPLIVPFYLSSKGYGIFLNSTFTNEFSFGHQGEYSISIDDHGFESELDLFYLSGGKLSKVIENYTELTGHPRLPTKAMFGLQLSDKGHDHDSSTPSDQVWWQEKIVTHRAKNYPLDHVVNDNRWRAAGGKRCESKLAWDKERYPNPAQYQQWLKENGLVLTLDFNRCIAKKSQGWKPSFNLPEIDNVQFPLSAPDLTNAEFRQWFWQVFEQQALKPDESFPGDALWIDEFDEQGAAKKSMVLSNGRSSAEMRNYWFFLIAKALVAEGWDKSALTKRPFVWVRGMTAGAQRYATLWSGDIYPNNQEMETQVRAMQLAGLSAFPYWGHDAGGFYDWKNNYGPNEDLYQRWSAAMGAFSPIWKPHGMGQSRWPLDRDEASQKVFLTYSQLRYQLMAYTYSAAHEAAATGMPIARAMLLAYQDHPEAWQYDLQYMWGDALLVAPQTQQERNKQIWLPPGQWYLYQSSQQVTGDKVIIDTSLLPIYVKAGGIVPQRDYALSTAFIDKSKLTIDLYLGADGHYKLTEDDDVTDPLHNKGEKRETHLSYKHQSQTLQISKAIGDYASANDKRELFIRLFGAEKLTHAIINGNKHLLIDSENSKLLKLGKHAVSKDISIKFAR